MMYNSWVENDVFNMVYSKDKKLLKKKKRVEPALFLKTEKRSNITSLYGDKVRKVNYSSTRSYYNAIRNFKENTDEYFGDIDPLYQEIGKALKNKPLDIDSDIRFTNFDIEAFSLNSDEFPEATKALYAVRSIQIHDGLTNKYIILGTKDYKVHDISQEYDDIKFEVKGEQITYLKFKTERGLIKWFLDYIQVNTVILTGWNIVGFDNLYLYNRCNRINLDHPMIRDMRITDNGGYFTKVQNLDYLLLYKKFSFKSHDSYKLSSISEAELGISKLEMKNGFKWCFKNDYQYFIDYGITDIMLPAMLEGKKKFILLALTMANMFKCNPEDTLSASRYWDSYLYDMALDKHQVVDRKSIQYKDEYIGGYVRTPIRGTATHSTLYDVESSYPTTNRRSNISPETWVEYKDLPDDLFEKTIQLLYGVTRKVYAEYRLKFSNEDYKGKIKEVKTLTEIVPNKICMLFSRNDLDKIAYPHMFIVQIKPEQVGKFNHKTYNMQHLAGNEYLHMAMSYDDVLEDSRALRNIAKYVAINNLWISEYLVTMFSNDTTKFKYFEKELKKYNYTITPNLQFFSKDTFGLIPEAQEIVFNQRLYYKKQEKNAEQAIRIIKKRISTNSELSKDDLISLGLYDMRKDISEKLQSDMSKCKCISDFENIKSEWIKYNSMSGAFNMALKIAINSIYGLSGYPGFRFYRNQISESTTSQSQLTVRSIGNRIQKELGLTWLYSDTDSNLYDLKTLYNATKSTKENYDFISNHLNTVLDPFIVKHFKDLGDITNTRNVPIKMDREIMADRTFMASKKRYYWRIIEKDYAYLEQPEYKMKGLSPVRSDMPVYVKKKLTEVLRTWIDNADNPKYAEELLTKHTSKVFKEFPLLNKEEIGRPCGLSSKFNDKSINDVGLSVHFKGSLVYNRWLKQMNLDSKFPLITSGMKVKFYLLDDINNNVFKSHVVSIPEDHPEEVWKYINIDYITMIDKTYMSLFREICEKNGIRQDSREITVWS